jgi:hypothetical protein
MANQTCKYIDFTNIDQLAYADFKDSKIINTKFNFSDISFLSHRNLLEFIYNKINDGVKIIKNSVIPIKTVKTNDSEFVYIDTLGIGYAANFESIQLREIFNQCKHNFFTLNITMELKDGSLIKIQN